MLEELSINLVFNAARKGLMRRGASRGAEKYNLE